MGSIDQRSTKLSGLKAEVLRKKSANLAITADGCLSAISPGSSGTRVESLSKFDGQ